MDKYKICVYAICKNEEKFVGRWMDSAREADLVVVTDTGSTDKTVEKLKEQGAVVYCESINPWRFDKARNIAMEHIPEDFDICVSIDLDEIFEPGWREKLEREWKPEHTRARYPYAWSCDGSGKPNKQFPREQIHLRHGYTWVHPVHEVLSYHGEKPEKVIEVKDMVLLHYPDLTKSRSQYLSLLELSAQENPENDRILFWLGREYFYYGKFDCCIKALKKHLQLESARWDEERCASMRFIAKSYEGKQDTDEAISWYYRAIAECPHVREPYYDMVKLAYRQENWNLVYFLSKRALSIERRTESYLLEPEAWDYSFYYYAAVACYYLGLFEEARQSGETAVRLCPAGNELKNSLNLIEKSLTGGVASNE